MPGGFIGAAISGDTSMTDLTRRDLLGAAAVGALAATLQACGRDSQQPAGGTATGAGATPKTAAIDVKFAIEGLSVVHREIDNSSGSPVTKFIRLAAIDPLANPDLKLSRHRPVLAIPRAILTSWEPEPLFSTMDYVYWSIQGWQAAMEVTVGGKTFRVGADTQVSEFARNVNAEDCADVRGKWANTNLVIKFEDVGIGSPKLQPNWHQTKAVAGYLELPFGVLEHSGLGAVGHEEFDNKLWHLGTAANPKPGRPRALKNIARIHLPRVEAATIKTGMGTIVFNTAPQQGYDWRTRPIVFSNLDVTSHAMSSDFTAYHEILMSPPPVADRRYPTEKVDCGTTVECGCCPPLAT